jgi:hypothetical protein
MISVNQLRLLTVAFAMSSLVATTGLAQERAAKAHVDVRVAGTIRSEATGVPSATAGGDLAIGDAGTYSVHGDFAGATGAGGWPAATSDTSFAWRVEARLLSVKTDLIEVSLTWGRYRRGAGSDAPEAGDGRVVSLKAGQKHVLDLVQSDAPRSRVANLIVEVEAKQVEDLAYAGMAIGYDLWLVHENRAGQKTTRRVQTVGAQGEKVGFPFPRLGFELDGTVVPRSSNPPLTVAVDGTILGRMRPDGAIDLVVDSRLWTGCRDGGLGGGGGRKEFVARDGETVAVDLPFGSGYCGTITGEAVPPNVRPGVSPFGNGLRVSNREFFEGDRLSLLVTARRQQ